MRLRILQAVCKEPHTINEIVAAVGSTQANVSKHPALLAAANVPARRKSGQCVYSAVKDKLAVKLCELVHAQLAGQQSIRRSRTGGFSGFAWHCKISLTRLTTRGRDLNYCGRRVAASQLNSDRKGASL